MLELKASDITTNHLVKTQSGVFSQVVKLESDGVTPVIHVELSNGFKFSVGVNTYLNIKHVEEIVNLYNLPDYIQDISGCSVSLQKGEKIRFTKEEAQALCERNNLTLVGAMWAEDGVYTNYLAIEDESIFILSLAHSYKYDETGKYISTPFLQANLDNCGNPSIFDEHSLCEEWNTKIGQYVNIFL